MAKQARSSLHPETTTPALGAECIEVYGESRTEIRAKREDRRRMRKRDMYRSVRKQIAKTERDPRELPMPDPNHGYVSDTDWESKEARRLYQLFCDILDGKLPEPWLEEMVDQAWGSPAAIAAVQSSDVGRIMPDDIIVVKHGVREFGLWLVLKSTAASIVLCAVDYKPYDVEQEDELPEPMDVPLKGHPSFAYRWALPDVTLELPTDFVTSNRFARIGWAKPLEVEEVRSLLGQNRLGAADLRSTQRNAEQLETLVKVWQMRQERCIRMAF